MKALVVVDYQVDFVDGALGFPGAEAGTDNSRQNSELPQHGGQVIFTLDTHGEEYLKHRRGRKLPVPHCIKGTPGHALYGRVAEAVKPDDIVIEKPAFGSLELADLLREAGSGRSGAVRSGNGYLRYLERRDSKGGAPGKPRNRRPFGVLLRRPRSPRKGARSNAGSSDRRYITPKGTLTAFPFRIVEKSLK